MTVQDTNYPRTDNPSLKDPTIYNITENVHAINSRCEDIRMRSFLSDLSLIYTILLGEVRLSTTEWLAAIEFLTQRGQYWGLFTRTEAELVQSGGLISQDPDGEPLFVLGTVKDTQGIPISGVKVDVWETDSKGFYDVQHDLRTGPDGRAILVSDENGGFFFNAIVPVPYPIPTDEPVGKLLQRLQRHPYRPSHMHFMFEKSSYDNLITALYLRGDPYENTNAVFVVKESLVVELRTVGDVEGLADCYCVPPSMKLISYDFVLVSEKETAELKENEARKAIDELGGKWLILDGLPVLDVD